MLSIQTIGRFNSLNAPWRSICKGIIEWINDQINWKINNGRYLSWHSDWNDLSPLGLNVPRLFALSQMKNRSIREAWNEEVNDWDFKPWRSLCDREINLWSTIKSNFPSISNHRGLNISLWKLNSNGTFSTMSVKITIHISNSDGGDASLYRHLWKSNIPKKMQKVFSLVCYAQWSSHRLIWYRKGWRICDATQIGVMCAIMIIM